MERQGTTEEDDWQAFSSIQTARYLLGKNKRTFSTLAEQDMIGDLIRDNWDIMLRSGALEGKFGCDKLEAFRSVKIVFPSVVLQRAACQWPGNRRQFSDTSRESGLNDRCLLRLGTRLYPVLRAHARQGRAFEWYILIQNLGNIAKLCHIDSFR